LPVGQHFDGCVRGSDRNVTFVGLSDVSVNHTFDEWMDFERLQPWLEFVPVDPRCAK